MDSQNVSDIYLFPYYYILRILQFFLYYTYKVITIEEANRLVGSLKSSYTGLVLKGYYLPKLKSACITSEYSLGVALMRVFICQAKDIKIAYLIKQAKKIDLYRELHQLVGQEIDLDFTSKMLPDREWLINVLYFVFPNHSYFKQLTTNQLKGLTLQDIYENLKGQIHKFLDQKDAQKMNKVKQKIKLKKYIHKQVKKPKSRQIYKESSNNQKHL
ncbi:unnamed protein product [Paramecium pentaurelia]|uniref:Uncharacterized protein n=1 Tax=Paramecium pentaurelia TaxID=43138 RepID=A0A8S1VHG9_9CILI|nr:unnamed protein product [Paramecium pentaurelia]